MEISSVSKNAKSAPGFFSVQKYKNEWVMMGGANNSNAFSHSALINAVVSSAWVLSRCMAESVIEFARDDRESSRS
jgi:hypothetical protein